MYMPMLRYFIKKCLLLIIILLPVISHAQQVDDAQQVEESEPVEDDTDNAEETHDALTLTAGEALAILFPSLASPSFEFYFGISAADMRFDFKSDEEHWSSNRDIGHDFDLSFRGRHIGIQMSLMIGEFTFTPTNNATTNKKNYYFYYEDLMVSSLGFLPLYRNNKTKARIELFASYGLGNYDAFYSETKNSSSRGSNGIVQQGMLEGYGTGIQFVFADRNTNKSYFAFRLGGYRHNVTSRSFKRNTVVPSGDLNGLSVYQLEIFGYHSF